MNDNDMDETDRGSQQCAAMYERYILYVQTNTIKQFTHVIKNQEIRNYLAHKLKYQLELRKIKNQ